MKEEPHTLPPVACTALLAFPIRHSYECESNCKQCLSAHTDLARWLLAMSGATPRLVDMLSDYRRWLDRNKIHAEGADGWGTRETFDQMNAQAFLREEWDCAAFDDANPSHHDGAAPAPSVDGVVGHPNSKSKQEE